MVPIQRRRALLIDDRRFNRIELQLRQGTQDVRPGTRLRVKEPNEIATVAPRHRAKSFPFRLGALGFSVVRKPKLSFAGEKRSKTNPMQLRDLISIEYDEKARNKPNVVIHNSINMLRVFLATFCRNINEKWFRFHSRFGESYILSMA